MTVTYHRIIAAERVREVLDYCPVSGRFTWVAPPKCHPRLKGVEAGGRSTGYVMIKIDGVKYKAHRLAWLLCYGAFPDCGIDHRDGNPFNNAIGNLRLATPAQNGANAKRCTGKMLPKGVRANGSGFTARISYQNSLRTIGTFPTPEQAAAAYLAEARRLYGEFARAS